MDTYLSRDPRNRLEYNDLNSPYDKEIYDRLLQNGGLVFIGVEPWFADLNLGMDELLAKHFAHLFIRDPLVIFSETIEQDDGIMSDHFEVSDPYTLVIELKIAIYEEYSIN